MAKFKVTHSTDACCIDITGDKRTAIEPSTAIITFPYGSVEVARATDCTYWVHVRVNEEEPHDDKAHQGKVHGSRIDYRHNTNAGVPLLPCPQNLNGLSVRLGPVHEISSPSLLERVEQVLGTYCSVLKGLGISSSYGVNSPNNTLCVDLALPSTVALGSLIMQLFSSGLVPRALLSRLTLENTIFLEVMQRQHVTSIVIHLDNLQKELDHVST